MKALKVILIIIVVLFAGYSIWMATIPADYQVERTATVDAPKEIIFSEVADFKNWEQWSAWHLMDSTMQVTYSESTSGEGASYSWTGEEVGAGTQTFKKIVPYDTIKTHLDFDGRGEGYGTWVFTETEDGNTQVKWIMNGSNSFFARSFNVFADRMVGPMFETGLANLKDLSETNYRTMAQAETNELKALEVNEIDFEPIEYYSVKDRVAFTEMGPDFFEKRYGELAAYLGDDFKNMMGSPLAIYHVWDTKNRMAEVEVALPIESDRVGDQRVKKGKTFEGTALKVNYYGPYENSGQAHDVIASYASENGFDLIGAPLEIYVTDPGTEPDTSKWLTEIIYPVKKK